MTFLEIEAFLNIVQHGSFSAAAEKLYVTQPALGRRIRALEEELGYTLFVRNKGVRHVELTKQGQAFIGLAQEGDATLEQRLEIFRRRKAAVERQIAELQETLSLLEYKCWYYKTALEAGTEAVHKKENVPAASA